MSEAGSAGLLARSGPSRNSVSVCCSLLDDAERRRGWARPAPPRSRSDYHVRHRVRAIESLYHEVLEVASQKAA